MTLPRKEAMTVTLAARPMSGQPTKSGLVRDNPPRNGQMLKYAVEQNNQQTDAPATHHVAPRETANNFRSNANKLLALVREAFG